MTFGLLISAAVANAVVLHPTEKYKFGSEILEKAEFLIHAQKVLAAQAKIQKDTRAAEPARVFHRKSHGCYTGKLILNANRGANLRRGIFSDKAKAEYNVLVRYSNGVSIDQHDLKPDVRGIAMKIFGVEDTENKDLHTLDLLMTNAPTPFGRDQEEFVEFMEAQVDPGFLHKNMALFGVKHPKVAGILAKRTLRVIKSLSKERFWSGHPYLLGKGQAVKFNISPVMEHNGKWGAAHDSFADRLLDAELGVVEGGISKLAEFSEWIKRQLEPVTDRVHKDYLRQELARRAKMAPVHYLLSTQLEKNPGTTPIEDGLREWTEGVSPSLPLADLILDQQDPSNPVQDQLCEKLAFTPGHHHSEHRPLSSIGRGRVFAYEASQRGRGANQTEPDEESLFETLRGLNTINP